MKKVIIITGKFVQDSEFIFPYHRFKEAGYEIDVATIDGKEALGVYGTKIPANITTKDIKTHDYNVLILPGGARAMEYLRQDQKILDFINKCDREKKPIACICHGTQLLISAKVVKGRKISGYYSIKDDVNNAGAEYINSPVVVDGNIITSPHYDFMGQWMKEVMKLVNKYEKRNTI